MVPITSPMNNKIKESMEEPDELFRNDDLTEK